MLTRDITFTYICDFCGAKEEQHHILAEGAEIPRPNFPKGWSNINDHAVCPKHRVSIREVTDDACNNDIR